VITTIVFENGARIYTSCRIEKDEEFVSLFVGMYRGPRFPIKNVVEILDTEETEIVALDYPIYMFLYQQYNKDGELTFVYPSSPLNAPIAAKDIKI